MHENSIREDEIPGVVVDAPELRRRIHALVGWKTDFVDTIGAHGFPGSQCVSFSRSHFADLMKMDYLCCEKSDGLRFLIYSYTSPSGPTLALMDRKAQLRLVHMRLPSPKTAHHQDTLIDAELVVDTLDNGQRQVRMLCFDLLVVSGVNFTKRSFTTRIGTLEKDVIKPLQAYLARHPESRPSFSMEVKKQEKSYGLNKVLAEIPHLKHENDGLIFTPVKSPYVLGTDVKLLKWKPPHMNSVDFKLHLKNSKTDGKQRWFLCLSERGRPKERFQYTVDEELRQQFLKKPPHGKVGEFRWDPNKLTYHWEEGMGSEKRQGGWVFMRFREDKDQGNDVTVFEKIWTSITDGVSQEELEAKVNDIRDAWKRREGLHQIQQQYESRRHRDPFAPEPLTGTGIGPTPWGEQVLSAEEEKELYHRDPSTALTYDDVPPVSPAEEDQAGKPEKEKEKKPRKKREPKPKPKKTPESDHVVANLEDLELSPGLPPEPRDEPVDASAMELSAADSGERIQQNHEQGPPAPTPPLFESLPPSMPSSPPPQHAQPILPSPPQLPHHSSPPNHAPPQTPSKPLPTPQKPTNQSPEQAKISTVSSSPSPSRKRAWLQVMMSDSDSEEEDGNNKKSRVF